MKKSWILDLSTDEDSITFIEFIFLMRKIMEKIEEGTLKNNPMNGVYIKIEKFSDNEYMPEFFKRARKLGG